MLASQMTSVSQATKSNFLLQATVAPSITIVRWTKLPRAYRHQHARSFRIGLWSSYLDPAFEKEIQRRYRVSKHKYAEALNRKLSWDRRLPEYATRWGLKGLMCSSWRAHDPRPGGRWVNVDELREVKDDSQSTGSRGIEEVEQNALDELLRRKDVYKSVHSDGSFVWNWAATKSTPEHTCGTRHRKVREPVIVRGLRSPQDERQFRNAEPSPPEPEYVTDPITNRKVFGNGKLESETKLQDSEGTATEIPVKTFKGYRSQFSRFGPPTEETEKKSVQLDGRDVSGITKSFRSTTHNLQDEVEKYKPFKYNEPDGKSPGKGDAATDKLRAYDHLYKPFKYNEPDGKLPDEGDAATDKLRAHDHLYEPFRYNEPDGKFPEKPDCVSECLSDFDHQYEPFKYNEPDGKFPEQSDPVGKGLEDYDHKATNQSPGRTASGTSTMVGQQPSNASASIQGNWLSQEGFSSNADLGRRGVMVDSRLLEFDQITAAKREDLDLMRASDIRAASGILKAPRKETQTEKDRRRTALESDFDQIQIRASSLAEEIAASQKVKEKQLAQDLELERSYLLNHNAHARGRVDAKIAELDAEIVSGKATSDAQEKVTGNFIRDFPEEFRASWSAKGSSTNSCLLPKNDTDAWGYDKSPKGLELSYQQEIENEVQNAENNHTAEFASTEEPGSRKMETSLHRRLQASESKAQAERDPYTKEPQGLETSYAEEVQEQDNCGSPLFVKSYGCEKKVLQDKELVRDIRNIYESKYGTIDHNHRQILEHKEKPETFEREGKSDGMQANIQGPDNLVRGLQHEGHERYMDMSKVSTNDALAEEQVEAVVRKHSSALTEPATVASGPNPTLYKILAYDPNMQTIKMAETASIVSDNSSALTPAEVLLRLSNPSKFFPHFQPLQMQGYEIASGSGDVLVFRKVREGPPAASFMPIGRKVVNPIDGMQSVPQPATGNFASPTGFVNHDVPSEHPFISGIDVRREEPVFSGRRTEWQDGDGEKEESGRKSKKFGRGLIVGAAWVAACSYAVGVVAEFFKTGGSDGKGPVGF